MSAADVAASYGRRFSIAREGLVLFGASFVRLCILFTAEFNQLINLGAQVHWYSWNDDFQLYLTCITYSMTILHTGPYGDGGGVKKMCNYGVHICLFMTPIVIPDCILLHYLNMTANKFQKANLRSVVAMWQVRIQLQPPRKVLGQVTLACSAQVC